MEWTSFSYLMTKVAHIFHPHRPDPTLHLPSSDHSLQNGWKSDSFCENRKYGAIWADDLYSVKKIYIFFWTIYHNYLQRRTRWIMVKELSGNKHIWLAKKNQGRRNEEKNNIPLMSLQIISKGHAKILETLETFPLLFPTFSFVFLQLLTVLKKIPNGSSLKQLIS
jgi:hypothetical protein